MILLQSKCRSIFLVNQQTFQTKTAANGLERKKERKKEKRKKKKKDKKKITFVCFHIELSKFC